MKRDDSGDGLRLLQEQLGHASFNTIAKYRKVAGEELKDWYNRLWQEEGGDQWTLDPIEVVFSDHSAAAGL